MRVSIQLEQHANNAGVFTSLDVVRGTASVQMKHAEPISKVVLSLQGRLETSLASKRSGIGGSSEHSAGTADYHKIFKLSQTLFPRETVPAASTSYTPSAGIHLFPFEICFPLLTACSSLQPGMVHSKTSLPPSFHIRSPDGDASVKLHYRLRVKIKRPSRFKQDPLAEKVLQFVPLCPDLLSSPIEPISRTMRQTSNPNGVADEMLLAASHSAQRSNCVMLEIVLACPSILFENKAIPLQLFVKFPMEVTIRAPVELRALVITLHTMINVSVADGKAAWTTSKEILRATGLSIPVIGSCEDEALFEVDRSLWKDAIIPTGTFSFTTCTARQQHKLILLAGISTNLENQIIWSQASFNVEIHADIDSALDEAFARETDVHDAGGLEAPPPPYV